MRALLPIFMTALWMAGFALGDKMPLLNAYELSRASGLRFLPSSGSRFIADQAMFGKGALAAGWGLWLIASLLLAYLSARLWDLLR